MANHKSAVKRARQNEKRRIRNKTNKTKVKNAVKLTFQTAGSTPEESSQNLKDAIRTIDKAASKGAIHKKTASRKAARLSKMVHKAQTADQA